MNQDGVMLHCWMSDITTLLRVDRTFFQSCRLPSQSPKAGQRFKKCSEIQLLKPFETTIHGGYLT